jgi:hypothetical protein
MSSPGRLLSIRNSLAAGKSSCLSGVCNTYVFQHPFIVINTSYSSWEVCYLVSFFQFNKANLTTAFRCHQQPSN